MATWSRESVLNFIKAYRSHECLWRIKSKDYSNRNLREKSYQELVAFIKTFEPEADKDYVIKKISNLRNAFRKQLKKLDSAKLSGSGAEGCEPTLWYFNALEFLRDQEMPRTTQSNIEPDVRSYAEPLDLKEETDLTPIGVETNVAGSPKSDILTLNDRGSRSVTPTVRPATTFHGVCTNSSRKRKAACGDICNELLMLARDGLVNPANTNMREDDLFDSFGKTVAHKLRNVSREQNIHAQKLIAEVLYEAELGTLSRSTAFYTREIRAPQPHLQMDFEVYRSYDNK